MNSRNLALLIFIFLLAAFATTWPCPSIIHSGLPTWWPGIKAPNWRWKPVGARPAGRDAGAARGQMLPEGRTVSAEDIETASIIIERRVNGLGVAEPLVQTSGERIIVALPGVDDPDAAVETLRGTGQLEFVDIGNNQVLDAGDPILTSLGARRRPDRRRRLRDRAHRRLLGQRRCHPRPNTQAIFIAFEFKPEGAQIFEELHPHAHRPAPCHRHGQDHPLGSGDQQCDPRRAASSKATLPWMKPAISPSRCNTAPCPCPAKSSMCVPSAPAWAKTRLHRASRRAIIGVIIVLLFMLIYYRLPGFLADLALMTYAALNLMFYKLLPVVLTLPGIAGFLLSTGMAVDANILIFERMKEELRAGRSLNNAVEAGFSRAWTSILDSNLSTLITCSSSTTSARISALPSCRASPSPSASACSSPCSRPWSPPAPSCVSWSDLFGECLQQTSRPSSASEFPRTPYFILRPFSSHSHEYPQTPPLVLSLLGPDHPAGPDLDDHLPGFSFGQPFRLSIDFTGGSLWEVRFAEAVAPGEIVRVFQDNGVADVNVNTIGDDRTLVVRSGEI